MTVALRNWFSFFLIVQSISSSKFINSLTALSTTYVFGALAARTISFSELNWSALIDVQIF